jgi:hypothetical protein
MGAWVGIAGKRALEVNSIDFCRRYEMLTCCYCFLLLRELWEDEEPTTCCSILRDHNQI